MKLYRFEKISDDRLKTLEDGKLWCSSPENFNDLSDCRVNMIIEDDLQLIPDDVINAIEPDTFNSPLGKEIVTRLLSIIKDKRLKRDLLADVKTSFDKISIRDHIINTTGACCFFSSAPLNSLMWAHYGDNHKGFCVEYDVDESHDNYLESMFEINYVSKLPEVSPEELLFSPRLTMTRVVSSKSEIWSYEKEYRIILIDGLSGKEKGRGKAIQFPKWLVPSKVICGANQKDDDVNYKMETLAVRLGVPRYRVVSYNGILNLQNVSKR